MSTTEHPSPPRLPKRSRARDAALGNMTPTKREGVKRRRTSTVGSEAGERLKTANALKVSEESGHHDAQVTLSAIDKGVASPSDSWSLSRGVAGQFTNLDPIVTLDEQYLFLGLETAVHVYSVATSCLFRVLEITPGDSIVGYQLSPQNQERLHIFTLSGSVSEWDWPSNKQLAHWNTHQKTISADLIYDESRSDANGAHLVLFSLRECKNGKKELAVTPLDSEEPQSTVVLKTNIKLDDFKIVGNGQAVVAYGGAHVFFGTSCSTQASEFSRYAWKEVKLAIKITCVDVKQDGPLIQHHQHALGTKKVSEFDLALGGADGSILVYHNALGFFEIGGDNKPAPRRLHWHRDSVRAVRWSKDGNYIISGGHESVMVLWQLDTGRKQFLPHLSSPISNIVVSGSGNSYAVKLADNRVVVLSARELQPLATITGLQLCARIAVAAVLHPQHSDQLLVAVPASHQLTQDGITSTSAPVLQTYDIRSNTHISRQALARTNATTLNIGPDGTQILTPDIKHLGVSEDGKWMATIDSWSPYPQDVEALDSETNVLSELDEIYLKFWRWNVSSSLWELVTRIDKPHLSDKGSAPVLDISSRPQSHEFATIGSDALLRLWRPIIKQRHGSRRDDAELAPETWKCRNTVDLRGYLESCNADSAHLNSASVCFSEDGSVLAACLQSTATIPGLIILIDVRSCSVWYTKVGVYSGDICATSFLGCHLIIATRRSVFIWDTVNDVVKTTDSSEVQSTSDSGSRLLAVNPRTHTFATASTMSLQKKASSKKLRRSGFTVQVYDIDSMSLLSRFKPAKEPVALLSNLQSSEYIVVDAGANISHADDLIQHPDLGLEGLFGRQATATMNKPSTLATTASLDTRPSERSGLASVFGDTPPFVLPPSRIVFRDLARPDTDCTRSVEQRFPVPATGFIDNPHPSLVISAANGTSYEPSDSDDESEIDIPASIAQASQPQLMVCLRGSMSRHHDCILNSGYQVQNAHPSPSHSRTKSDDDELPKSVIHAPAGFSEFRLNIQPSLEESPTSHEDAELSSETPMSIKVIPEKEEERMAKKFSNSPISPPPLTTSIEPAKDWSERATPRAQTRQDFDDFDRRSHSSNLEDIPEGIDKPKRTGSGVGQAPDQIGLAAEYFPEGSAEIKALQAALVECWSLCNTLATLSSIHRERTNFAVEAQDDAWKSCWRLCQQLYAGQVDDNASQVNPTLDLCRDFCQTLFEARSNDNEISDSVLRVSFELNNHLYNTHDRNLPDAFRERTLDFYITLCHRLMKQRTRVHETDSLLSACWSLAEMLFSIRQSKKEGRPLDEELLGSAVQACWELCDIFREGWTQRSLRNSDRGTPRPSQATFTAAEKQTRQSDIARAEEALFRQRNPETPTTIFEDVGTTSPEEGPVQNIFVLGQRRRNAPHTSWSSNASSISGRTQSSERTSSTSTVVTLSNEFNLNSLRVLMAKAAMNGGFQRNGSQSLSSFVKSLSSDAFGPTPWQMTLLKHYKGLVAIEPEFQSIGPPTRASAIDIARAIKLTAQGGQYLWLYDLYRLVFGFHVEEVVNRDVIMLQT
ncbi:hypothetical protein BDW59DRAFT_172669 [Aspergillus cavernicola]|uniref:DUF7624 domain-containing protein n=1 Tax=Aspergillus cavernicola TaxID=176166 RepID=A0ABR4IAK2_9EURO